MLHLTHDTEQLARKVAARAGRRPEDLIRAALEREARELGVYTDQPARRRMTVEQMMAVGKRYLRCHCLIRALRKKFWMI